MTANRLKPTAIADQAAEANAEESTRRGREWWRLTARLLRAPREVFVALRSTDDVDLDARAEPITAIAILAGMAAVFLSPRWGRLLDDSAIDELVVAVLTFIAGCFYGAAGVFLLGLFAWLGARGAGADPPFRLARHLVAFSALPFALSILVNLPLALVWFGADWFHEGGADSGGGRWVVTGIGLAAAAWSAGLLATGLRVTFRLSWFGVVTALALAGVIVAGLAVLPSALR
ncbi:MAG: Yip1 family protein [Gaiellales bacterium]